MKRLINILFLFFICFLAFINISYAEELDISSRNVIFIDLENNNVIYEKNKDDKVPIASLTKIMTAIISIENISDYNQKVVVTNEMLKNIEFDYSKVGFVAGDVITYNDLLYGTLLKSGADATNILAISTVGSIDNFVKLMNEKAKQLGMDNTYFTNTIGVDIDNPYSSAKDVAILLKYAFNNEKFKDIFQSENYLSTDLKYDMSGPLKYAHSDSFKMDYLIGAKTGYTKKSGLCLASISLYNNRRYLLVTLGADNTNKTRHFLDSKKIYEYYFSNYDYVKILSKDNVIANLKTEYDEEYKVISDEDVTYYLNKSIDINDLIYEYDGDNILNKKIKKNDKIGVFYIKNGEEILYKKTIYSKINVQMPLNYFFKHNIVLIITILVLFILLVYSHKKRKVVNNIYR